MLLPTALGPHALLQTHSQADLLPDCTSRQLRGLRSGWQHGLADVSRCDAAQAEGAQTGEPAARLGETGDAFTRRLSASMRRSVGLPPAASARPSVAPQAELAADEASLHARATEAGLAR